MNKRIYLLGAVLGLVMPVVGVFFGLQVSTTLGNILAFPVIAIAAFTDMPFGTWHAGLWIIAMLLSVLAWTLIVALIDVVLKNMRRLYTWKTIGVIVFVTLMGGFFLLNSFIEQEKQGNGVVAEPYRATLAGKNVLDQGEKPHTGITPTRVMSSLGDNVTFMNLTISPKEIVSDSRCPADVVCVWAGTVEVRTTLATEVSHGEHILTVGEPQTFGTYTVTLVEVSPIKKEGAIPASSYELTYLISSK